MNVNHHLGNINSNSTMTTSMIMPQLDFHNTNSTTANHDDYDNGANHYDPNRIWTIDDPVEAHDVSNYYDSLQSNEDPWTTPSSLMLTTMMGGNHDTTSPSFNTSMTMLMDHPSVGEQRCDKSSSSSSPPPTTTTANMQKMPTLATKKKKKKTKAVPKKSSTNNSNKPKRSLNCYNFFFQHHRALLLFQQQNNNDNSDDDHLTTKNVAKHVQNIGFKGLAETIAKRWKRITPTERAYFEQLAAQDKIRHARELQAWKQAQQCPPQMRLPESTSTSFFDHRHNKADKEEWNHLIHPRALHVLRSKLSHEEVQIIVQALG